MPRFERFLKGEAGAVADSERLDCAYLAMRRGHTALGTKLFTEALAGTKAPSEDDLTAAAGCAARAATGEGEDVAGVDEAQRRAWRARALAWLRADLVELRARTEKNPSGALNDYLGLRMSGGLAGIRDETALDALPADEARTLRAFWKDLEEVGEAAWRGLSGLPAARPCNRPVVAFLHGQNLQAEGNRRGALRAYEKVQRLDPEYPRIRYWRGLCHLFLGEDARAIELLREASRRSPNSLGTQRNCARFLSLLGDTRGALAANKLAISLAPGDAKLYANQGVYYQRLGQYADALVLHRRATGIGRHDAAFVERSRKREAHVAHVLELGKRLDEVVHGRGEPDSPADRATLGLIAFRRGRAEDAARLFFDAYREEPALERSKNGYRLIAMRAMAQAGAEPEARTTRSTPQERAQWRDRALGWLRDELRSYEKLKPRGDNEIGDMMRLRVRDPALAGIRDETDLARLTAAEARTLRAFWIEVDEAVRKRWEDVR